MAIPVDKILQPKGDGMKEVMHGTPDLVVAWLKHRPNFAKRLYVKDSAFDLLVTAQQYVKRHETGAVAYPEKTEEHRTLRNYSEWVR